MNHAVFADVEFVTKMRLSEGNNSSAKLDTLENEVAT